MTLELNNVGFQLNVNGGRVLVLPSTLVSKLYDEFYKIVGEASPVIMRELGKGIGEIAAEMVESEIKEESLEAYMKAIAEYLTKMGFG